MKTRGSDADMWRVTPPRQSRVDDKPAKGGGLSLDDVALLLKREYGLTALVTRLTGERDANFRIDGGDGNRWVFKVAHLEEPQAVTDLQVKSLLWLEETKRTGLEFPAIWPASNGAHTIEVAAGKSPPRSGRLLTFVPGKILRAASYSHAQRRACGTLCARMAEAFAGFSHPGAAGRDLIWDFRQTRRLRALLEAVVPDARPRSILKRLLDDFDAAAVAMFAQLPRQVIHHDLHPGNILTDDHDASIVRGVIDFGDVCESITIADAAISLTGVLDAQSPLGDSIFEFITAYRRVRELDREEAAALPLLIGIRLAMVMLIPAWHRLQEPDNPHFADHKPQFELRTGWIEELIESRESLTSAILS